MSGNERPIHSTLNQLHILECPQDHTNTTVLVQQILVHPYSCTSGIMKPSNPLCGLAGATTESPEAAAGVVEDVPLRWTQRDAAAQRNQYFLRQL